MIEDPLYFELPNGLRGDPVVYVPLKRFGEAFCFDLGSVETLSHRDLMKICNVFVSHTHMDHFIGFDRLLRVHVPHSKTLRLWGPAPFIDRVQAKLRSYTWNLVKPDQILIQVYEICADGQINEALLSNTDQFEIHVQKSTATCQKLWEWPDGSTMSAVLLDHKGIASVSYQYKIPGRMRVLVEKMTELGLSPGAWVGELQDLFRRGDCEQTISIAGQSFLVGDLARKIISAESQRALTYLTDVSFDRQNTSKLKAAFGQTEQLLSECSFLDRDAKRALDKAHLTSRHAALYARLLGAKNLHVFHFSAIYGEGPEVLIDESQEIFERLKLLDDEGFEQVIGEELERLDSLR